MNASVDNPCLACGACCKSYRVSFYWTEALPLPDTYTEQLSAHLSCMRGTNAARPHCIVLGRGEAGPMACGVYEQRPQPCREVEIGDDKCRRARQLHGLAPLPAALPA